MMSKILDEAFANIPLKNKIKVAKEHSDSLLEKIEEHRQKELNEILTHIDEQLSLLLTMSERFSSQYVTGKVSSYSEIAQFIKEKQKL